MNRLAAAPVGLSIYLPLGHPDLAASEAAVSAAIAGGADWIELGFPFSDPAADGPVIEAATHAAVQAGTTVSDCLAAAARLRKRHPETPFVAMTYANLAHRMGWDRFAAALAAAGIDGLILADVPLEESSPIRAALARHDVAWIPLVTPSSDADRMAAIAATCTGFLYVVGNTGTTGQAGPGALVEATVARAQRATQCPIAVGFGIHTAADVQRIQGLGASAIVGTAAVRALTNQGVEGVRRFVEELLA